jgi:hypothetical protein
MRLDAKVAPVHSAGIVGTDVVSALIGAVLAAGVPGIQCYSDISAEFSRAEYGRQSKLVAL